MDPHGDYPAMVPPPGVVPNFDNYGGQHAMAYAAIIICSTLVLLSTSLRVWSRLSMKPRSFGIEEVLLICALVSKHLLPYYMDNYDVYIRS